MGLVVGHLRDKGKVGVGGSECFFFCTWWAGRAGVGALGWGLFNYGWRTLDVAWFGIGKVVVKTGVRRVRAEVGV